MIEVKVTITDTESGEQKDFVHTYDERPILLAIEYPSVELGLSLGTEYDEWQKRFGSEYNFLNRNMGES